MVEISGIEPLTFPAVNAGKPPPAAIIENARGQRLHELPISPNKKPRTKSPRFLFGGDKRDRTADLLNAIQALSQLSYTPRCLGAGAPRARSIIAEATSNVKYFFRFSGSFLHRPERMASHPEQSSAAERGRTADAAQGRNLCPHMREKSGAAGW